MNKEELVNEISGITGFTKKDCLLFVDVFCDVVGEALKRGERVKIHNFGAFQVKECKARTGKNFVENTSHPIPPKRVPGFTPGDGLRKIVQGDCHDCD